MPTPTHDFEALPTDTHAPSFRQELRVIGVLIAFVALLEVIARILAPNLDYDRKHIFAFPQIITGLNQRSQQSDRPRVVFLGNSLMRSGLSEAIFSDELQKLNAPSIESAKITPVGTAMIDWLYLYQRYFNPQITKPDALIVGFYTHHIHDQEPIKIRRLSRHFVAKSDFPALWTTDLDGFHEIVQSALCGVSALEGDQPEHQLSILSGIVSNYQAGLKINNRLVANPTAKSARRKATPDTTAAPEPPPETFQRMERFIKTCQADGVSLYFVAMPQPHHWNINPEAIQLTQRHGIEILDATSIDAITEADFEDGYHLGPSGTEKFSRWLAAQLAGKLRTQ